MVAGPLGREAEAGVSANLSSAIYAYSRSKGLFAGIALDGAVLSMDKDMNSKVYGSSADAKSLLNGNTPANSTVRPFIDALDKVGHSLARIETLLSASSLAHEPSAATPAFEPPVASVVFTLASAGAAAVVCCIATEG